MTSSQLTMNEKKMKTQNRSVRILEGLYFLNHQYEKDLALILKPMPIQAIGS